MSLRFLSGTSTFFMWVIFAASTFSFKPPMGSTRPRRVISPVMATLADTFFPVTAESMAVAMVMPAEGAVPKDGPSAGITLTTALASLVTGKTVDPGYAMTGEVSLRGVIMPIGGLPEKLMAAQRAGVKRVFIPEENTDDLADVAQEVKDELEIIPVHQVRDVLCRVGILDGETGSELRN